MLAIRPQLAKLPYDPVKDFAPIVLMVTVPNILVVHPSVPAKTLPELIAYAKANPGKLTYASQGIGASGHIAGELLKLAAGVDITHVPYRGAAPAAQDLAAGHVSMMFDVVSLALGPIKVRHGARARRRRRRSASPCCPTCRRWPKAAIRSRSAPGSACWRPPARRGRSSTGSTARPTRCSSAPDARDRFVAQGAAMPLGTPEDVPRFHRGADGALRRRDPARRHQGVG